MAAGELAYEAEPSLLVGDSEAIARARRQILRAAPTESSVLLLGETGTGKGLAARELHAASRRAGGPFVHVDCAALSPALIEGELFGHERGAFTGAVAPRPGRLELARGGTLFLDEIGELDLPLQGKLLRALQDRRFERLGGTRSLALDARVVAATHRDLRADVRSGRFRKDLWFRLCVLAIDLPPLRARPGDVGLLLCRALPELVQRLCVPPRPVKPEFVEVFSAHDWPGNVRELLHALERALLLSDGEALDAEVARVAIDAGRLDAPASHGDGASGAAGGPGAPAPHGPAETTPIGVDPPGAAADAGGASGQRERIAAVLRATGGNLSRAARRLGVPRSTLRWQVQRLALGALIPDD